MTPEELSEAFRIIDKLAAEGYDFTWCRNAGLIDDEKSYVRFHRMGHYGTAEGSDSFVDLVRQAYTQLLSTEAPKWDNS